MNECFTWFPYKWFRRTLYISPIGLFYKNVGILLGGYLTVKDQWELLTGDEVGTWETNFLPVQSVIRIFLEKKLWRLEQPYPRSYMAKVWTKVWTNGFFPNWQICKPLVLLVQARQLSWQSNGLKIPRPIVISVTQPRKRCRQIQTKHLNADKMQTNRKERHVKN